MSIKMISAYNNPEEVGQLFSEYTRMLIKEVPAFKDYLDMQNYAEEIKHLEEKYGKPRGRLYLAYHNDDLAGCIGLRKIDEQRCEMKRLYVRPEFRAKNIGKLLVEQIIRDAQEIGYIKMLLDTFPFLESALRMYKSYGFKEIACYNDNPIADSVYLELELKGTESF